MNAVASALSSRAFNKLLPWISGAILLVGVATFLIVHFGLSNTAKSIETPHTGKPARVYHPQKTVPLDPTARRTAGEFILTAVSRTDLAKAYTLAGPGIKQGMTRKEWLKGNIPVVPYPADEIRIASFKTDYSYKNNALLEVALLPKNPGKVKAQIFFIELKRYGNRWLVDGWVPRGAAAVPTTLNG